MEFQSTLFGKDAITANCADHGEAFGGMEPLESRLLMRRSVTWGYVSTLVHQDQAVAAYPRVTGLGETIAIIDTGVDYNAPTMGGGFGRRHKVVGGYDFLDNDADPMDTVGHGTAVATIAAGLSYVYHGRHYQGIAPDAQIVALRVDDGSDVLNPTRVTQALQWVLDHQAKYNIVAANISEGEYGAAVKQQGDTFSGLLAQCAARGIFVAASSGNNGLSNAIEYPGYDPNVASVGSLSLNGQISDFTDTAPALDLLAPGEDVVIPYLDNSGNLYYTYSAGTSFAAPFAAGTAALLKQINPALAPRQMLSVMQSTGTTVRDPDNGLAFKSLNLVATLTSTVNSLAKRRG